MCLLTAYYCFIYIFWSLCNPMSLITKYLCLPKNCQKSLRARKELNGLQIFALHGAACSTKTIYVYTRLSMQRALPWEVSVSFLRVIAAKTRFFSPTENEEERRKKKWQVKWKAQYEYHPACSRNSFLVGEGEKGWGGKGTTQVDQPARPMISRWDDQTAWLEKSQKQNACKRLPNFPEDVSGRYR